MGPANDPASRVRASASERLRTGGPTSMCLVGPPLVGLFGPAVYDTAWGVKVDGYLAAKPLMPSCSIAVQS